MSTISKFGLVASVLHKFLAEQQYWASHDQGIDKAEEAELLQVTDTFAQELTCMTHLQKSLEELGGLLSDKLRNIDAALQAENLAKTT
eukprot:g10648.t1